MRGGSESPEFLAPLADMVPSSAAAGSGLLGGGLVQLLPFVAIIGIMYFLMIRPQQKKEKQRQEMVAALKRGDRILTTGGFIGTIYKVLGGGELLVEIAEGTRVRLLANAVSQLIDKTSTVEVLEKEAAPSDSSGPRKTSQKRGGVRSQTPAKATQKTSARKAAAPRRTNKTKAGAAASSKAE